MMEEKKIYAAINAVMNEVGAVGKNHRNDQQKYQYRGIDDVMSALAPAMQKHGVFVIPEVLDMVRSEKDGRNSLLLYSIVKVKYRFVALDGSFVEAVVMGEGMDSGDKATNKAMAAAFKYALLQTFCIPTDELVDSEQDSPEVVSEPVDPLIPQAERDALVHVLRTMDVNVPALLKMYNLESENQITKSIADSIKRMIENAKNSRNNKSDPDIPAPAVVGSEEDLHMPDNRMAAETVA